jgi:hypothetical protein
MIHFNTLLPPALKQTLRTASNPTSTPAPHTLPLSPLTADTFEPSNKGQRDGATVAIHKDVIFTHSSHIEDFVRNVITRRLKEAGQRLETDHSILGLLHNEKDAALGVLTVILRTLDPLRPERGLFVLDALKMLDEVVAIIPNELPNLKEGLRLEIENYNLSQARKSSLEQDDEKSTSLTKYFFDTLTDRTSQIVTKPSEELSQKAISVGEKGLLDIPTGFGLTHFTKDVSRIQRSPNSDLIPYEGVAASVNLVIDGSREPSSINEAIRIAEIPFVKEYAQRIESVLAQVFTAELPENSVMPIHNFAPAFWEI